MDRREFVEKNIGLLLHPETDVKVMAISNRTRRIILGILYVYGPLFNRDLKKYTGLSSNKLAYHMKILKRAGYVSNTYLSERSGKTFSKYSITEEGIRFLEYIGAKSKLDEIVLRIKQNNAS